MAALVKPAGVGASRERTLPHDVDAEQSIIGGILLDNGVLDQIDTLEVEHFYDHRPKVVFQAIRNLRTRRIPIDIVTLEGEIARVGRLEAIGGVAFLGEVALKVPTPDNVVHYAKRVRDLATIRRAALVASAALERAYGWQDEADEYLGQIVADLAELERAHMKAERRAPPGGRRLREAVAKLKQNRTAPVFKTGLAQVDDYAQLMGGHVIVLIGGSGSGKSTLTLQVTSHHAATLGPALIVSLELDGPELVARILSRECGVTWFGALRGEIGDERMMQALDNDRIRIVDDFTVTPNQIRNHVLALNREYPNQLVLVVVDYIQLLEANGRDERERLKRAIESLRTLAKDLDVVLLLVSQTSRAGGKALRSGDLVGVDASTAGAETSQIERAAYVTLTLGEMTDALEGSGITLVDMSIGKSRFRGGDRIVQLEYDGARGSWREHGEVVSAAKHKADKAAKSKSARIEGTVEAIAAVLAAADAPMSQRELRKQLRINNHNCSAAVTALLGETTPRVARVKGAKEGGHWPLWSPAKAASAGVDLVPQEAT